MSTVKKAAIAAGWVCALGLTGCGDKAEPKPEPATPAATEAKLQAETTPAEPPKPAAEAAPAAVATPDDLPNGLLLAYAQFEVEGGKVVPKPGAARLEILTRKAGKWSIEVLEDPDSNVFHKAMVYAPADGEPGILTFGGMGANVKLWRRGAKGFEAKTLWSEKFGGKWDRMRDGEVGDVYGDGKQTIVVATHDQGVVAALKPKGKDDFEVVKLGARPDTFVHEIELGDVNGDGAMEAYATPSEPNKLEGGAQSGLVWRFVPKEGKGPEVAADLGNRHAKEIYVGDVDGDGRDELYVAVEAHTEGKGASLRIVEPVEIRRYDADTPAGKGKVVATLPDRLNRFLTVGDVDGDGKKEMIAAAYRSGLWLLKPGASKDAAWKVENIDRRSSGFEHASILTDLDGDGTDELYVAADEQGEFRRYVWKDGKPVREPIHRRDIPGAMMTWNIMPVPVSLVAPAAEK